MSPEPSLSVVVPVYGSEATLEPLVTRLRAVLEPRPAPYEIVLVNDGGGGRCWEIIERLAAAGRNVRGIRLLRNYGQHNALLCGIRAAAHDVIVTMDDDLQNPPEEIPKLLAKLGEGFDVVYGTAEEQHHGFWRGLASRIVRRMLGGVLGAEFARHMGPFRAFRADVRKGFLDYRSAFVSIDVLLTWGGSAFGFVAVRQEPRGAGPSTYTFWKLIGHGLDVVTSFSVRPLRLASWIGFLFTLFGFVVLGWTLGRFLWFGYSVPGFPFLASAIAIFAGAQLFALGIIGEYLARVHMRSMGRPYAVVRETVGFASGSARPGGGAERGDVS